MDCAGQRVGPASPEILVSAPDKLLDAHWSDSVPADKALSFCLCPASSAIVLAVVQPPTHVIAPARPPARGGA
ncbi:hypothetical protein EVG20_g8887 [Dentipellis fragilis]|uniref:Uncharacterized protein n=1 Tax=Dentipellis fragilis TaxID=205917 RepID=A0A4Y9Y3N9_9AGAM|nr:hypothetical protein EVG20_g8887 [Dentipellis fragilis]